MKVLEINSVCGYGSTGRIAVDLCTLLESNHHSCHIAYGRGQASEELKTIKIGNTLDVFYHGCLSRLTDRHGFYSVKATKSFLKEVKMINPDIIHLHNIHGYYMNIELLFDFIKENNINVIWTLHDCWSFTGHCAHFDYIGCEKWKTECNTCEQIGEYPKSYIDHSTMNYKMKKKLFTGVKNLQIITPSNWLASLVKKSFLKNANVQTIHNGIDLNLFKPLPSNIKRDLGINDQYLILCSSSIWTEKKGFDHIIEMSKQLDKTETIVMVGVTSQQMKKLPSNIIGIERTNNVEDLVKLYTAADVFINPTLEDNYPTVNLEAIACGTPVITYPTGGSIESIVNEEVGYVCKDKTVESLLTSLRMMKDSEKNPEIIRNYAVQYFDKNKCFQQYVNVMETMCRK